MRSGFEPESVGVVMLEIAGMQKRLVRYPPYNVQRFESKRGNGLT